MKTNLFFITTTFVFLVLGCAKSSPEPEPAEQVVGSYTAEKITESIKYATETSEVSRSNTFPIQGKDFVLTALFDVTKKAPNMVNIVLIQTAKYNNGKTEKDSKSFDSIELKKTDTNAQSYDLYDQSNKIGVVGNNMITITDAVTEQDSLKRVYTYTLTLTGKKGN